MLLLWIACTEGPKVNGGQPEPVIVPGAVDFGEVVIGTLTDVQIGVENDGLGFFTVTGAALEATSQDFEVLSYPPDPIGAADTGELWLRYTPDYEGQDYATLRLTTDLEDDPETAEDESEVTAQLAAFGVLPRVELEPELLYYSGVTSGTVSTKSFTVASRGSGKLVIRHMELEDPDGVYTLTAPAEYPGEPAIVENGFSVTFDVAFAPLDEGEHNGQVLIETNDPEDGLVSVDLRGNAIDNPDTNVCPVVEVLSPDNGEYILSSSPTLLRGLVVDPDDAMSNLDCSWFANGARLTSATVDSSGNVEDTASLPIGQVEVKLRCIDLEICAGDDSTDVEVVDAEQPLRYTITGGSSIFDYLFIDDDLSVYVNGVEIYVDSDRTSTTLAPIEFEAERGDTIRLVGTDVNQCMFAIDALKLHWGTGQSQNLNSEDCRSSCPQDACYDANYNGPWPGVFLDETYDINIP